MDIHRRPHRALLIVAVRDRRAEQGHDGIAHVLIDGPAVGADDAVNRCEQAAEHRVGLFGPAVAAVPREIGEIGKENGDLAPLDSFFRGNYIRKSQDSLGLPA